MGATIAIVAFIAICVIAGILMGRSSDGGGCGCSCGCSSRHDEHEHKNDDKSDAKK